MTEGLQDKPPAFSFPSLPSGNTMKTKTNVKAGKAMQK